MKSQLISATIHAGIISLALLQPRVDIAPTRPEHPNIVIYRPPPADAGPTLPGTGGSGPRTTIPVPTTVPPNIPPIDVAQPGPATVTLDSTWEIGPSRSGHGDKGTGNGSPTGVLSADIVDVQVTPYAGAPTPRYPESLRAAGIDGEVTLEFVVDTSGRLEAGSVRKISSTADAFVVSVCDALAATRYHPALVAGRRVRQLVHQQFVFSLTQH